MPQEPPNPPGKAHQGPSGPHARHPVILIMAEKEQHAESSLDLQPVEAKPSTALASWGQLEALGHPRRL